MSLLSIREVARGSKQFKEIENSTLNQNRSVKPYGKAIRKGYSKRTFSTSLRDLNIIHEPSITICSQKYLPINVKI